ncbi:MAG: hypothetical protein JO134_20875 [Xanthobacteraceae bacterium]|nr:hypothetical protein [Xanthobacteraceae bacterium]
MKKKQRHDSHGDQKFNLGQHEASLEKDKDAKLSQMGERSKPAGRQSHEAEADRKR